MPTGDRGGASRRPKRKQPVPVMSEHSAPMQPKPAQRKPVPARVPPTEAPRMQPSQPAQTPPISGQRQKRSERFWNPSESGIQPDRPAPAHQRREYVRRELTNTKPDLERDIAVSGEKRRNDDLS